MKKIKSQKGITLVVLIITIIVLLLLVAVTISTVQETSIIARAKNAVKQHEIAEEEEKIKLAHAEYVIDKKTNDDAVLKVEGATVYKIENEEWKVIFDKTESEYIVDKNVKITYIDKKDDTDIDEKDDTEVVKPEVNNPTIFGNNTASNNTEEDAPVVDTPTGIYNKTESNNTDSDAPVVDVPEGISNSIKINEVNVN